MDRKSRFLDKYMRNLSGTGRGVTVVFNGKQRSRSKAPVCGVQAQMRAFYYFYGLRLGILLLRYSNNLSALLQTNDLCAAEAGTIAKDSLVTLKKMRTDENCIYCGNT